LRCCRMHVPMRVTSAPCCAVRRRIGN